MRVGLGHMLGVEPQHRVGFGLRHRIGFSLLDLDIGWALG